MSFKTSSWQQVIAAGFVCLGLVLPSRANETLETQVGKAAVSTTLFDVNRLLYGTAEEAVRSAAKSPETMRMQEAFKIIQDLAAQPQTALKCTKHADPKVRTLGMLALFETLEPQYLSAIASLIDDEKLSFPRPEYTQSGPVNEVPTSVGDIAMKLIEPYLRSAGISIWPGDANAPMKLKKYLAEHKNRQFFGLWKVKWNRASGGGTPADKSRYPAMNLVKRETDALPSPDRELLQLTLWTEGWRGGETWLSEATLVAMAKRLNHEQLLALLSGKQVATHPDLTGQSPDFYTTAFLLDHAAELLQPADADLLLQLGTIHRITTPCWVIGASRLAPLRAVSILKSAIPNSPDQADLVTELWKVAGEAERPFIVDWFYATKELSELNQCPAASRFLSDIRTAGASAKPLLKAIISDPRLDQVGLYSLRELALAAKEANGNPIIDDLWEVGPRGGKGGDHHKSAAAYEREAPQEFARMIAGMKSWRARLVLAAQAW